MVEAGDDKPKLPTIHEWLSEWAGVQLPGLPSMPQTLKNLDKAIGSVVLALGDNVKARVAANTGKVDAGGKIDVDDLVRNAEERRKLENRAAIAQIAVEDISTNPGKSDAPSEVETDWLNTFSRLSEDKSSDDLRLLFGKILAGEIRSPGSFSLRTLQFVASISKPEAELISKFLCFAFLPGIVPNLEEITHGPDISQRLIMEELGLASHPSTIGGLVWGGLATSSSNFSLLTKNIGITVQNKTEIPVKVEIGCQTLSQPAKDLMTIAGSPDMPRPFLNEVAKYVLKRLDSIRRDDLKSGSISVSIVEPISGDDRWRVIEILKPEVVLQP